MVRVIASWDARVPIGIERTGATHDLSGDCIRRRVSVVGRKKPGPSRNSRSTGQCCERQGHIETRSHPTGTVTRSDSRLKSSPGLMIYLPCRAPL